MHEVQNGLTLMAIFAVTGLAADTAVLLRPNPGITAIRTANGNAFFLVRNKEHSITFWTDDGIVQTSPRRDHGASTERFGFLARNVQAQRLYWVEI